MKEVEHSFVLIFTRFYDNFYYFKIYFGMFLYSVSKFAAA